MRTETDAAVSPVIGVMLMIVVTIIIAAIVSSFSGGISGEQKKSPNTAIEVYDVDTSAGTITFKSNGGDEIALNETLVTLVYNGQSMTLSNADKMTGSSTGVYLNETGSSDGYISAADMFTLLCDTNDKTAETLTYKPSGAASGLTIPYNAHVTYMIIDKTSSKQIVKGEFVLR